MEINTPSFVFSNIVEHIKNCPRDTFIDKLLHIYKNSFELMNGVRTCFYEEAIKNGLVAERPLIKRRRGDGDSGSRKLASDCFLLYNFITNSMTQIEIKELFCRNLPVNLNSQFNDVSSSPPSTPRALNASQLTNQHTPTYSASGKTAPVLLYDTLAEMKAEILAFKADVRSDYEALQKQVDDIEPNHAPSMSINAPQHEDDVMSLQLQMQECMCKIATLEEQVHRRTQRISKLESELACMKSENTVLRHVIKENVSTLTKGDK